MFRRIVIGAMIVAGCAGAVRAAAQDEIQTALQKLADSDNYSWTSTVEGGFGAGTTEGKTQKDGLTHISITRQDTTTEIILQGEKGAAKMDDGWKSISELAAADGGGGGGGFSPERMVVMTARNFKTPVATVLDVVGKLQKVEKTDDGYSAELNADDAAKQLLMFRRRPAQAAGDNAPPPPTATNASASFKFWIKDGAVSKIQSNVKGTVTFNGNDRDVDRTTTIEFKDIGSTKITIPDEAKAKLSAAPATQP